MSTMGFLAILWQLFNIAFFVLIIVLVVILFRSHSNRSKQLERMEDKIDHLIEKIDELTNTK